MRKSKKQSIVEGATALFAEFGIKRVTVEEICEHVSASKATFYKYFGNKTGLVLHIVTTLSSESSARFKQKMDENPSFEDLVKEILLMKLDFMEQFSPHFIKDLYEGDIPEIQQALLQMHDSSMQDARTLYDIGQTQNTIDSAITFEYFLYLLNQLQQTYTDEQVIAIYPDAKERLHVTFNQFFFGLMGRNTNENGE